MPLNVTPADVVEYPLGTPPDRVPLDVLAESDPRKVVFRRAGGDGEAVIEVVGVDGQASRLAHRYVRHSPTGMEFGFGGSGPADTALNILALVLPVREAARLHQRFKFDMIATVPRAGGSLSLDMVRAWIRAAYTAELADVVTMADEAARRADHAAIAAGEVYERDPSEANRLAMKAADHAAQDAHAAALAVLS